MLGGKDCNFSHPRFLISCPSGQPLVFGVPLILMQISFDNRGECPKHQITMKDFHSAHGQIYEITVWPITTITYAKRGFPYITCHSVTTQK